MRDVALSALFAFPTRRSSDLQFDYDRLLWGERQIRSVANMTRSDARDFLETAADIQLRPKVTSFALDEVNDALIAVQRDRKSTRLNSSHLVISYAVFCLKKQN